MAENEKEEKQEKNSYSAKNLEVLEGLDAVRMRPGMYIGSTGVKGLHHILWEIVDNAIDEAANGYANKIKVVLYKDGSASVEDNGRGIPTDIHPKEKVSGVQLVFTKLHAGGKFGQGNYQYSGGLHGVGSSVVNALSEWLEVEGTQNGHVYAQRFERGKPVDDLHIIKDVSEAEHGTLIRFKADADIFQETTKYSFDILQRRLREQAFLNAGLSISLCDKREKFERDSDDRYDDEEHTSVYCYEGGIRSFVEWINESRGFTPIQEEVIHISTTKDDRSAEVALCYTDGYTETNNCSEADSYTKTNCNTNGNADSEARAE